MTQIEFLEMIRIMIDTREIKVYEGQREECLNIMDDINKTLMDYWKDYIIKEIQAKDCCHPSVCGYDNWYSFFSNTDGSETEEYIRALFTEEECENIWQESHRNN